MILPLACAAMNWPLQFLAVAVPLQLWHCWAPRHRSPTSSWLFHPKKKTRTISFILNEADCSCFFLRLGKAKTVGMWLMHGNYCALYETIRKWTSTRPSLAVRAVFRRHVLSPAWLHVSLIMCLWSSLDPDAAIKLHITSLDLIKETKSLVASIADFSGVNYPEELDLVTIALIEALNIDKNSRRYFRTWHFREGSNMSVMWSCITRRPSRGLRYFIYGRHDLCHDEFVEFHKTSKLPQHTWTRKPSSFWQQAVKCVAKRTGRGTGEWTKNMFEEMIAERNASHCHCQKLALHETGLDTPERFSRMPNRRRVAFIYLV